MEKARTFDHEFIKRYGGKFGVPIRPQSNDPYDLIHVPFRPHIFYCPQVELYETNHEEVFKTIDSAVVMMAHGEYRNNEWQFIGTGEKVADTYKFYNEFRDIYNYPPIDIIVVCNPKTGLASSIRLSLPVFLIGDIPPRYIPGKPPSIHANSIITIKSAIKDDGSVKIPKYKRGEGAFLYLESEGWSNISVKYPILYEQIL